MCKKQKRKFYSYYYQHNGNEDQDDKNFCNSYGNDLVLN